MAIPVIVLVFGIAVVGCDTPTNGENDTWSEVTGFDQMNGTWRGSYSINNQSMKDMMEAEGVAWDDSMQAMFGDLKVSTKAIITLKIDTAAKTEQISMVSTLTFSGGNINVLWDTIKLGLTSVTEDGMTVTTNDATHSVIMTLNYPADTLSDQDIADMESSGMLINQDGTKIKYPANTLEQGTPELIFVKQ